MKKSKYVKKAHCPACGSGDLTYRNNDVGTEWLTCYYGCNDCNFEGEEVYAIQFNSHQFYINSDEGYEIMYEGQTLLQEQLSFAEYQAKHMKRKGKRK